jgi:hypothetical protein
VGDSSAEGRYRRGVPHVRRLPLTGRLLLAGLLALCLGVRLLTPPGFMPSFANGSLALVECPGARASLPAPPPPAAMSAHHLRAGMAMARSATPEPVHDHDNGFHRQSCPFAAMATPALIDAPLVVLTALAPVALPPLALALPIYRLQVTRDRPPSQGPPPAI